LFKERRQATEFRRKIDNITLVGDTWGKGVLNFKGKTYPLKVDGLSAVSAGAEKICGTGAI